MYVVSMVEGAKPMIRYYDAGCLSSNLDSLASGEHLVQALPWVLRSVQRLQPWNFYMSATHHSKKSTLRSMLPLGVWKCAPQENFENQCMSSLQLYNTGILKLGLWWFKSANH